jgi:hypothetical protein
MRVDVETGSLTCAMYGGTVLWHWTAAGRTLSGRAADSTSPVCGYSRAEIKTEPTG